MPVSGLVTRARQLKRKFIEDRRAEEAMATRPTSSVDLNATVDLDLVGSAVDPAGDIHVDTTVAADEMAVDNAVAVSAAEAAVAEISNAVTPSAGIETVTAVVSPAGVGPAAAVDVTPAIEAPSVGSFLEEMQKLFRDSTLTHLCQLQYFEESYDAEVQLTNRTQKDLEDCQAELAKEKSRGNTKLEALEAELVAEKKKSEALEAELIAEKKKSLVLHQELSSKDEELAKVPQKRDWWRKKAMRAVTTGFLDYYGCINKRLAEIDESNMGLPSSEDESDNPEETENPPEQPSGIPPNTEDLVEQPSGLLLE